MFGVGDPDIMLLQEDVEKGQLLRLDVDRELVAKGFALTHPEGGLPPAALQDAFTAIAKVHSSPSPEEHYVSAYQKIHAETDITAPFFLSRQDMLSPKDRFTLAALGKSPLMARALGYDHPVQFIMDKNREEFMQGRRQNYILPAFAADKILGDQTPTPLGEMVQDGHITCTAVECMINSPMIIFGQPGQEENMAALVPILQNGYNGKEIDDPTQEGNILGYSDTDIDYWLNRSSYEEKWGPALTTIMQYTNEARRNIRVALMKEAGPAWPRNL